MKRITVVSFVVAAFALLPFYGVSYAGGPTERVRSATDGVIEILKDPAMKAPGKEGDRRAKIRAKVYDVFDFGEMAKRSLARNWKKRTPDEQKEFSDLFADLLERSYINKIEGYSDEEIVYDGEKADEGYAVVNSRFITKRREEIPVDYKLMYKDGAWNVYDVVIEGVSLVNNYRIQFNKIIRSSSYEDLVRKMKNKAECEELAAY